MHRARAWHTQTHRRSPLQLPSPAGRSDWFTFHVSQNRVGGTQTIHSCSLRCGRHSRPRAGQTVVRQRHSSCYRRTTLLGSWGFRFLFRGPETNSTPYWRCICERTPKILFLMTETFYVFQSKTDCGSGSRFALTPFPVSNRRTKGTLPSLPG